MGGRHVRGHRPRRGDRRAGTAAKGIGLSARINDVPVESTSDARPLPLQPRRNVEMIVTVTNRGSAAVEVHDVRLEGTVIGLTFFRYDTAVFVPLPPGQTESRHIQLDVRGQ